jgi:hypothetical protein
MIDAPVPFRRFRGRQIFCGWSSIVAEVLKGRNQDFPPTGPASFVGAAAGISGSGVAGRLADPRSPRDRSLTDQ